MANITFISHGIFENLSIEYLSSFLKKNGHKVNLLIDPALFSDTFHHCQPLSAILNFRKAILDKIIAQKPNIVCFSVSTDIYQWAITLAREIKKHLDTLVIFGGIHPTLLPELVVRNNAVDIVCVGEGEGPLLELADSLDKGAPDYGIKNLWFKKDGKIVKNSLRPVNKDLSLLPFPDKDIFYKINPRYSREYFAISGRGCPFNCSYCSNHIMRKLYGENYLRKRTVDNVIAEIVYAKDKYKMSYVWFVDDLFVLDKKWLRDFSNKYAREIKIPFFCYLHPEYIDEEMVALLKAAGCHEIGIGVQTISLKARKAVRRSEPIEKIKKAIMLVKREGMLVVTENIVGLPYETEADLLELAKFYNNNRPSLVLINWLRLFPKSDLLKFEKEEGLLGNSDFEKIEEGSDTQIGWKKNLTNHKLAKKLAILLEVLPFLPTRVIEKIIKKKIYRFIPYWGKCFVYLMRIFRYSPFAKLIYRNSTYDCGARIYVRNYFYFVIRRLQLFLKGK